MSRASGRNPGSSSPSAEFAYAEAWTTNPDSSVQPATRRAVAVRTGGTTLYELVKMTRGLERRRNRFGAHAEQYFAAHRRPMRALEFCVQLAGFGHSLTGDTNSWTEFLKKQVLKMTSLYL